MYGGMAFEVLASTKPRLTDDTLKGPIGWLSPGGCRDGHGSSLLRYHDVAERGDTVVAEERWWEEEVEKVTDTNSPDSDFPRRNAPLGIQSTVSHKPIASAMIQSKFGQEDATIFCAHCHIVR